MKTMVILGLVAAAAVTAPADPYSAAIRQANHVATSAPQQENTRIQEASAAPTQAPPPNPQLEATLQNIANLRVDFDNLARLSETNSTDAVKSSLLTNLFIAAQGTKPSQASAVQLVDHLTDAMAGRAGLSDSYTKLAQDVHAIFNSSHLTAVQQETLLAEVQQILQSGGVTTDLALNVVGDLKAIAEQTSEAPK
ncbi:MAG TPA: hypothetical protein VFV81_05935 [Verrucomicrobiae bacterium]|nr:hypothetical protein [Verrucomicrobiae bacterium]